MCPLLDLLAVQVGDSESCRLSRLVFVGLSLEPPPSTTVSKQPKRPAVLYLSSTPYLVRAQAKPQPSNPPGLCRFAPFLPALPPCQPLCRQDETVAPYWLTELNWLAGLLRQCGGSAPTEPAEALLLGARGNSRGVDKKSQAFAR